MFGLVLLFTVALLKSSPAAEAVHPPPGSDDAAGAEDAVGLAQSGSPYCPLIFSIVVLIYCNRLLLLSLLVRCSLAFGMQLQGF